MLCRSSTTNSPSIALPSCASDGATAFGKMYFSMNGVPWRRLRLLAIVWMTRDAVVDQAPVNDLHHVAVVLRPDVLHHADRHDAVERAADVAVVAQPQLDVQVLPQLAAERDLVLRQRDADDRAAVLLGGPRREAAPAAAEIEHAHARAAGRACGRRDRAWPPAPPPASWRSSSSRRCRPCAGRACACRDRCRCRSAPRPNAPERAFDCRLSRNALTVSSRRRQLPVIFSRRPARMIFSIRTSSASVSHQPSMYDSPKPIEASRSRRS